MTALVYYTDTGGADTNSGTTSGTSPLANGTAATRATNVYTLDGSPDLSGVTANQDTIHIVGETSGRGNDGTLFEITAVDDGADTVTVSPTPTGGTSGLTWAIGGAFATIDKAMSVVDAGDKVWMKATANYNETVTIDTVGTQADQIVFEGYTTTPGDNGKITIDGQSTRANCVTGSTTSTYYVFKNIIVTGATSIGWKTSTPDSLCFINCEFHNNGNHGLQGDNNYSFINCESYNNSQYGIDVDINCYACGCFFHGNANYQYYSSGTYGFYKNVVYNPGNGNGVYIASQIGQHVLQNTFDGDNTGATAILANNAACLFMDNIVYDWTTGWSNNATPTLGSNVCGWNLFNSNTNDLLNDTTSKEYIAISHVTSAPSFTDEAGDDYTLGASSPAIDAGLQPGGIT